MGLLTDLSNFAVGAIERDREKTQEAAKDRADELIANRNSILKMKEEKYKSEIAAFEDEQKKAKAITSTNAKFADSETIKASDWGSTYLKEYKPDVYASILKMADGDTDLANAYFAKEYTPALAKFETSTTRDKIDNKIAKEIEAITATYSDKIKNAKGDSFLIKKLIGEKENKVAEVTNKVEEGSKGIDESSIVTNEVSSTDSKELPFKIEDEELSFTVPKKFREELKPIREKLNSTDAKNVYSKKAVSTTQKFFNDNDVARSQNFYIKDKETGEITGFKGPASTLNTHITQLTDGVVDSITNYEIYSSTGKDSSLITNKFNETTVSNLVDDRIRNYTNISQDKKIFNSRENIVGIVPFSIVDANNTLGDLQFNTKLDKKLVGEAYIRALKIVNKEMNPDGVIESNQKFMNDLQSELLALKNGTNKNSILVKELMLQDLKSNGIGTVISTKTDSTSTDSTSTGESVVGKITITDPISNTSKVVDNTEANKKLAKEKGFTFEIVKPPVEIKQDSTGDGSVAEQVLGINESLVKESPTELGDKTFTSLESVLKILPEAMTGAEIKEKYNINFKINDKSLFRPLK